MSDDLIPFGKYRGQPLATLAADRQYAEWLTAQPWFRERYASLYTVVINNFAPSEDTPEHNALQAQFLDAQFCTIFAKLAEPDWPIERAIVVVADINRKWSDTKECRDDLERWTRIVNQDRCKELITVRFEVSGIDVEFEASCSIEEDYPRRSWYGATIKKLIEIKPTIGDDYPTVLRQMKALKANTLYLDRYTGEGITERQLIRIFENEGIRIVFKRDLDALL